MTAPCGQAAEACSLAPSQHARLHGQVPMALCPQITYQRGNVCLSVPRSLQNAVEFCLGGSSWMVGESAGPAMPTTENSQHDTKLQPTSTMTMGGRCLKIDKETRFSQCSFHVHGHFPMDAELKTRVGKRVAIRTRQSLVRQGNNRSHNRQEDCQHLFTF